MKRLAIIGAGEFQDPLIRKAKEMGYETHVFAWKCGAPGEKTADFFYPVSIVEKVQILEVCRAMQPAGIVSIASDLATLTVNYIAEELGLACNSRQCTLHATNKFMMREAFLAAGVPTPRFFLADVYRKTLPKEMRYPVIVKPTDRSGSRGIMRVESEAGLAGAIDTAMAYSFEQKAIVEEFIEGEEYSCECISFGGRHTMLALTQKFTTGIPHYIETGHMQPADIAQEKSDAIRVAVFCALDALGIEAGASHTEFKLTPEGKVRIIEIGARMGGDCIGSHLVPLSTGYDFLKMVIDVACGKEPDFTKMHANSAAGVRFVFSQADIDALDQIRRIAPGIIAEESPVGKIDPAGVVDSSTRAGYYILTGEREKISDFLCL